MKRTTDARGSTQIIAKLRRSETPVASINEKQFYHKELKEHKAKKQSLFCDLPNPWRVIIPYGAAESVRRATGMPIDEFKIRKAGRQEKEAPVHFFLPAFLTSS
jgi:hypothetical protein